MRIDILGLISHFQALDDCENSNASYRTRVPWVRPEAYLNIVFKPAPSELLSEVAEQLRFPPAETELLRIQNGAILFSGALSLYGVVERGRLLNRTESMSLPPFNIEKENAAWHFHRERLLVVGRYRIDGSRACLDRIDGKLHVFEKAARIPRTTWPSLEAWIISEISRFSLLFDPDGRTLLDPPPTS
jgi:hypothetical protein